MRRLLAIAFGLAAVSCSPGSSPEVGGETHWLAVCSQDGDCGGEGLQCICGTCTKACAGDEACNGGQCYDSKSPLLLSRCEDFETEAPPAICLAQCEKDAECGSGRSCAQGACVPIASVRISDFADVSDEVSWTEAIATAPMVDAIEGATPGMLGSWRQIGCDPAHSPTLGFGCYAIDIEQDASGLVRGRMRIERTSGDSIGPFAPATDPDVAYPTELDFNKFSYITFNPEVNIDYRLLDARVFDERLTFRWNFLDLWDDWCALQRPYRWEIDSRSYYYCVPQDHAEQARLDRGKVAMCGSGARERVPACTGEEADPRCSDAYCVCDSQGCSVAAATSLVQLTFAKEGTSAVLKAAGELSGFEITLGRSSP